MEFNVSVSNPMLMGCIQLMKEENTPEHRNMFTEELLKATLVAPAIMEPAPVQDADGKLAIVQGTKIQFPMLEAKDGKKYFMGFTDLREFQKWAQGNTGLPHFGLSFDDYASMLQVDVQGREGTAVGFVINPMGDNIIVPREMVAGIMALKTGKIRLS